MQQQVDDVKAVMCAAAERPCSSLHATLCLRVAPCHLSSAPVGRRPRAACRQENVEVMLANIDKTEVLENKSAALADQAKT